MFIGLRELGRHDLSFREDFQPGTVDFRTAEFGQASPLHVEISAELDGEEIHLSGRIRGDFDVRCARCLAPVRQRVERDFELIYRPLREIRAGEDLKLQTAELEVGFYRGDGLFLADVLAEQVNLEMPAKPLCSEECRGLCPHCGADLNKQKCRCRPDRPDSRWDGLAQWKRSNS